MNLELHRFWFLLNQIERLKAEDDLRQLQNLVSASGQEGYNSACDHLLKNIGDVYVWVQPTQTEFRVDPVTGLDPEFDREGLHALARKMQAY